MSDCVGVFLIIISIFAGGFALGYNLGSGEEK